MRKLLLLIIFFTSLQNASKGLNLKVKIENNKYWLGVMLIIKNDTINKVFEPWESKRNSILFKDLEPGFYEINILSKFGDVIKERMTIQKNKVLKFKTDDYYKKNSLEQTLIEQMKFNDTLNVVRVSYGCFHYNYSSFSLVKLNSDTGTIWEYLIADTSYLVSNKRGDWYQNIELKIRTNGSVFNSWSTTTTSYSVEYNKMVIDFEFTFDQKQMRMLRRCYFFRRLGFRKNLPLPHTSH
jgi:hypothetical protein